MLNQFQSPLSLVARILMALLFIPAGLSKIAGFDGTVAYIGSAGLPAASLLAVLTILVEVAGGAAIAVGLFTRWAALILAGFTVLAALFFHAFWSAPAAGAMVQQIMFMKNIAIAGGLLALAAFGAGALSVDARRGAA